VKTSRGIVACAAAALALSAAARPAHVTAKIADAGRYASLNPHFAKAFEFLARPDLATLAVGRYEIDGDNCWAMVQEANLTPLAGAKVEAHRRYVDIQAPLTGPETYGLMTMDAKSRAVPFDVEKDYVLFDAETRPVTLRPGEFAIFFPPDGAHAPSHSDNGERTIRKLVIKVKDVSPAVVDFGPDGVGGYPEIEVTGVKAPAKVRVVYATHPDGLGERGDFWHETRATYLGPEVWLPILPANTDRFDVFDVPSNGVYRAPLLQGLLRYAKGTVVSGAAEVKAIRLVNDGVHSDEEVVGSFACSDEKVNGVWKASVRTCQLAAIPGRDRPLAVRGVHTNAVLGASLPYLSDGAKRDRLVWSGDLWWAQRNMYAAFPIDSPFMPGSIRMLASTQQPCGYVQAAPFPESCGPYPDGEWGPFGSDEFAAWFVPVLCDHVLHTADFRLAAEMLPKVGKLVGYLNGLVGADGLFEQRKETCKNAAGLVFGATSLHHRSYMHILLWKTYRDAATLATWCGREDLAKAWTALADRMAVTVRKAFWVEEKGYFAASVEVRGFAPEGNPLALASRFATPQEAARIVRQMPRHSHGKFQAMAARGAFEYGFADEAMKLIAQHNWYAVLDPGWKGLRTTSECMGLIHRGWGDEAHPDTAIAGVFGNYILGLEPLEPGYAKFRVKPQPAAGITWAKGRVPTPKGFIEVGWQLKDGTPDVTVRAPAGCERVL